ncbi:MAG: PD-(D/E)XK nuclease family transposase [Firmicutes bacterium]|nr:PD-(D/E)XK nuclease family transposase [Bacillota bacterium]
MCSTQQSYEAAKEILKNLRPIDDAFFREIFRNNKPLTEYVLRLFLNKPDLVVIEQETQYDLKRLLGARSLCLDVKATDSAGAKYNIEAQKAESGADPYRARYHLSSLDVEHLNAGQDFNELPITYVIFITETDIFNENKPIYRIERINIDTSKPFNDGEHILYINTSYINNTSPLGNLLHDFLCSDPNDMITPEMADRTRYFKETPKGVAYMSKIMEDFKKEAVMENAKEIALNILKEGQNIAFAANVTKLSVEIIKQLAIDNNIPYIV